MRTEREFDLCGDHLALNFANTVSERLSEAPVDRLARYEDLVRFLRQSAVLSAREAGRASAWAGAHQAQAERVLAEARALREALYRIFQAIVEERVPAKDDLQVLNQAAGRLRLDDSFRWVWSAGAEAPDALLAPLVRAALELLTGQGRGRVRVCDAEDCAWLFFDTSKNGSRRWCDMSNCGNRAKARRFAARH